MDSNKYFNKQLSMLKRARLLSQLLLLMAILSSLAAIVLPPMQKAAVRLSGEVLGSWDLFLLQLPRLDRGVITWLCLGALLLLWMAFMLKALVSIAETQCAEFDDR